MTTIDTYSRAHLRPTLVQDLITVGNLLRAARLNKGITKSTIAKRLYVDPVMVWRIENGYPIRDLNILWQYADIVGAGIHIRIYIPLPRRMGPK